MKIFFTTILLSGLLAVSDTTKKKVVFITGKDTVCVEDKLKQIKEIKNVDERIRQLEIYNKAIKRAK